MLGNYEKRLFSDGGKVWLGRYRNLKNVLHWHFECEIIRVVEGSAQIKVGEYTFDASAGDCFFCAGEQLHYITSTSASRIDIIILDRSVIKDITKGCALVSPKLPKELCLDEYFALVKQELDRKERFYREALEAHTRKTVIGIFRSCPAVKQQNKSHLYLQLISKINEDFSFITFQDAVRYSGYSPSHFSKMFKKLSGMSFSEYLNVIKVEQAILMIRNTPKAPMSTVCVQCGFSTVRNFNRVFKQITGFSPSEIPENFAIDIGFRNPGSKHFDPTDKRSTLL